MPVEWAIMARTGLLAAAFALTSLFASGCASYVPFTQELRDQHNLQSNDLKNLQFYNSHKITLRREVERGGGKVTTGHKLLVIAGKQIEEVVIDEKTPGVIVGVSENRLRVSFEEGTFMEFTLRGDEPFLRDPVVMSGGFASPPDPFPGNNPDRPEPRPRALHGTGNFWLIPVSGSTITFQGQNWEAIGESSQAHLVISTESLEEVDEDRTVLKGRTL